MKKKVFLLTAILVILVGGVITLRYISKVDKQSEIAVVTYVTHPVLNKIQSSFEAELNALSKHEFSYKLISYNAQGDKEKLPSISRQVLAGKPEIVVTISTPVTQYLMRSADENQKIVYTFVTNPNDLGNDRLRTNSTGLSDAINYTANIDLIWEIYGKQVTIGMIYNPNEDNSVHGINRVEKILNGTESSFIKVAVQKASDIPTAVSQLLGTVDVIYVGGDNMVVGNMTAVVSRAHEKGIPVFASDEGSIENGAVAGVSVDYERLGRQTAQMVINVLKGKEPREMKRVKLEGDRLLINQNALRQLGITIPNTVMDQAYFIN